MCQVVVIDLVLAGDNAIVVGLAASGVAPHLRHRAVTWGLVAAVALRVTFSLIAVQMLAVVGLTLAGGLLLLWVCWKLYREASDAHQAGTLDGDTDPTLPPVPHPGKSIHAAIGQIVIADISMSLDNVLAVAGAARDHTVALVAGLVLSVALMGIAASVIAPMIARRPWLAYVGLTVILYVACEMIYHGGVEVVHAALTTPLSTGP